MINYSKILKRISYKENFHFLIRPHDIPGTKRWILQIDASFPDVNGEHEPTHVTHTQVIPLNLNNEAYFVEFVFDQLLYIERHECQEWFSFDGVRIFDPHNEEMQWTLESEL